MAESSSTPLAAARNACKLCAPLGACLAFRGIEGAVPLLHGSQGCATYIRRYMISHSKEPLDIASSSFGEAAAIFGGRQNLFTALENVIRQYGPRLIGVATTCLAETIGDDVAAHLREFRQEHAAWPLPALVNVATPSYAGTHADGYFRAVRAIAEQLAEGGDSEAGRINLIVGMISPADIRYLKEVTADFGLAANLFPDISDTMDGPAWEEYQLIPPGGTPLAELRRAGRAMASVELGGTFFGEPTAGAALRERFNIPLEALPLPIGIRQSDAFFKTMAELAGGSVPERHTLERGRLIDAFVDSHKHVFGKRAIVYGEEDLVAGIAALLAEVGIVPALCASGGPKSRLREAILAANPELDGKIEVRDEMDFAQVEEAAAGLEADLLIGSSKGYPLARKLGVPLVRIGFPIHDRVDGTRLMTLGYRGAQQLFDRIANALIEAKQDRSPVGYFYM